MASSLVQCASIDVLSLVTYLALDLTAPDEFTVALAAHLHLRLVHLQPAGGAEHLAAAPLVLGHLLSARHHPALPAQGAGHAQTLVLAAVVGGRLQVHQVRLSDAGRGPTQGRRRLVRHHAVLEVHLDGSVVLAAQEAADGAQVGHLLPARLNGTRPRDAVTLTQHPGRPPHSLGGKRAHSK